MTAARLIVRPAPVELGIYEEFKPSLAHPWFVAPLQVPISFDEVNEVRVVTQPLEVRISYPRPIEDYAGKTLDLEMTWLDDPSREKPAPSVFREPVRESYTFAALQPGRYKLAVITPGAAWTTSKTIEVKKGVTQIAMTVAPAPMRVLLAGAALLGLIAACVWWWRRDRGRLGPLEHRSR